MTLDDGNTNMKLAFENCEFIGLESLAVSTCMLWSGETPIQGYIVFVDVEASLGNF